MATCAEILQIELPDGSAEDSVSFLPALKGQPIPFTRKGIVHHAIDGHFAYRQGKWKLLLARGSGGLTSPREKDVSSDSPEAQLYNLETDLGESNNLYHQEPRIAAELLDRLTSEIKAGRSVEGPIATNDVPTIKLWKNR